MKPSVVEEGNVYGEFTSDKPAAEGDTLFPVPAQGRTLVSLFGAIVNRSFLNTYDMFSPYNNVVMIEGDFTTRRSFRFLMGARVRGEPGVNAAGSPICALAVATPLTVVGKTATFTTVLPHGFATGTGVKVEDAVPLFKSQFTGYFAIDSVPSETSFIWRYPNPPGGNAPPGAFSTVLWRVGQNIVERNSIELGNIRHPNGQFAFSTGIYSVGPRFLPALPIEINNFTPLYEYPRVVARENLLSLLPPEPNPYAVAIEVISAENLLVEKNIVDFPNTGPLFDQAISQAHYFNNHSPAGTLIKGHDLDAERFRDELATRIEDALILSL